MASSGKKGKKSKGKTLALNDFLHETTSGTATLPVKKYSNWSDEVEDALESGYESRPKASPVVLPTAPRAARGPDISDDRIPTHSPFIAYISNLPYDVDEEDISEFFSNMQISSMRLPRDDRGGEGGKLKGFGYVEFEDRNSLIDAISIIDTNLKGRRIKIDVATSSDGDRRRGGRMDIGRDRPERPEVTMSDWRSGPRREPAPDSREGERGSSGGGGGGGGFRDRDREGAPESNRPGAWRDSNERPAFREPERERGFSRDSDRAFSRDSSDRVFSRDSERSFSRDGERTFSRDSERGGGYREGGGRYGDRDDRRGGGFGGRRYGGDRDDKDRDGEMRRRGGDDEMRRRGGDDEMRRRGGDDEMRRRDDGPTSEKDQPRSRVRLVLAPRTKPIEEQAPAEIPEENEPVALEPKVPAASIFGAAKPVDTSARERQIEERLAKEKETRPAPAENNRTKEKTGNDDEEKSVPHVAWSRQRDDEHEIIRKESPERRPNSRDPPPRRNDDKKPGVGSRDKATPRKDDRSRKEDRRSGDDEKPPYVAWGRQRDDEHEVIRKESPERRPNSRGPPARRNDDKKPGTANRDKAPPRKDERSKREDRRDNHEREMPKLKEPKPPNFAASNIFATLEPDDTLDD